MLLALSDDLARLHELQLCDVRLSQREKALNGLDNGDRLKAEAILLIKRHDAAAADLKVARGTQKDLELAVESHEAKRKVVHDRLYSGRTNNPKELGDLERDEEMISGQIRHIEDELLVAMERVEAAAAAEAELAALLAEAKHKWQVTVAHFRAETLRLTAEIAALRPERASLAAAVEPGLLRHYDDLRPRLGGVALAVTGNDMCPVCHVRLTASTSETLREGEVLTHCDNCLRILSWVP